MSIASYAIGCLVQWYESDIIEDYFISLKTALETYKEVCKSKNKPSKVFIDVCISSDSSLEKPLTDSTISQCLDKIITSTKILEPHPDIRISFISDKIYSISDYRRDFNHRYAFSSDVLIWGESDMLVPMEMFTALDSLMESIEVDQKFIATFGTCKMWDSSWTPLEHPMFTSHNHSDSKEDWWGLNYDMTIEEMYNINNQIDNVDVSLISPLKFNGCGLVISSSIIKSGLNVPGAAFFVHEDTAFLTLLSKTFPDLKQYHFSNILLVHNRKHKNKRNNIRGETGNTIGEKRKSNNWYVKANTYSAINTSNLFNTSHRYYSWEDVFNAD